MRLIDADAAIQRMNRLGDREYRRRKDFIDDAIKVLSSVMYSPTVDAVPVESGKWEYEPAADDHFVGEFICSVCQSGYREDDAEDFNYCPNCGAKMEMPDDEDDEDEEDYDAENNV